MWYPGQALNQEIVKLFIAALNNDEVKAELYKQMKIQMDNERAKNGSMPKQSYDSLTSGNVNMQARMAASGYDVYGRTVISSNQGSYNNKNAYRKMKNQIKYGRSPQNGYDNRGSFNTI